MAMEWYHHDQEQSAGQGQGGSESKLRTQAVDDQVDGAHGHHDQGDLPAQAPERLAAFVGSHDSDHGECGHEAAELMLEKNQAADHGGQDDDFQSDRHLAALAGVVPAREVPHQQAGRRVYPEWLRVLTPAEILN